MKRIAYWTAAVLAVSVVHAGDISTALEADYRSQGAGPFDAAAGRALWTREFPGSGGARSCATCHGTDLRQAGKHVRTGKAIEPLAPSANAKRLSDASKVEKWFTRNCKWTIGRACTAQEKGDVLNFIRSQ